MPHPDLGALPSLPQARHGHVQGQSRGLDENWRRGAHCPMPLGLSPASEGQLANPRNGT